MKCPNQNGLMRQTFLVLSALTRHAFQLLPFPIRSGRSKLSRSCYKSCRVEAKLQRNILVEFEKKIQVSRVRGFYWIINIQHT